MRGGHAACPLGRRWRWRRRSSLCDSSRHGAAVELLLFVVVIGCFRLHGSSWHGSKYDAAVERLLFVVVRVFWRRYRTAVKLVVVVVSPHDRGVPGAGRLSAPL